MLIDARQVAKGTTVETDVCIIGAGAAGITLAREFNGQSFDVCLLESGGFEFDRKIQSLYDGPNVGHSYFPLDSTRLRYFGGTTNHWQGACIPLSEIDFEVRDWVPYSGWPITRSDLIPYYHRALAVCEIGPFDYRPETWGREDRPPQKFASNRLINTVIQDSPPTRFGKKYRKEIIDAPNIDTYLHANVLEIEANEDAQSIVRLRVASLEENTFFVKARIFILATGGIENARMLLLSDGVQKTGLCNQNDLVGRFFMDHPVYETGYIFPTHFNHRFYGWYNRDFNDGGRKGKVLITGYLKASDQAMRENKLLHGSFRFELLRMRDISEGVKSLREIVDGIKKGDLPDEFMDALGNVIHDIDDVALLGYRKVTGKQDTIFRLISWSEHCPNPDSRVSLHTELDELGQRKVKLAWRLNDQVRDNIVRMHEILSEELGRAGLGRMRLDIDTESDDWLSSFRGSNHHMGTTRMHNDPSKGVVDANCRAHGIDNLYIAGSSVFPTSGQANPTFTIVALALRMADRIKGLLA
jgi:choline dehydrogenase-like flavoprotein